MKEVNQVWNEIFILSPVQKRRKAKRKIKNWFQSLQHQMFSIRNSGLQIIVNIGVKIGFRKPWFTEPIYSIISK